MRKIKPKYKLCHAYLYYTDSLILRAEPPQTNDNDRLTCSLMQNVTSFNLTAPTRTRCTNRLTPLEAIKPLSRPSYKLRLTQYTFMHSFGNEIKVRLVKYVTLCCLNDTVDKVTTAVNPCKLISNELGKLMYVTHKVAVVKCTNVTSVLVGEDLSYVTPMAVEDMRKEENVTTRLTACMRDGQARPYGRDRSSYKETRGKNLCMICKYHNYHLIMVISTRANSAVNKVLRPIKTFNTQIMSGLSKLGRGTTRRSKEPTQIQKPNGYITLSNSRSPTSGVNYTHNYSSVVISTRGVFAVFTVIKLSFISRPTELGRLSMAQRRVAIRSRGPVKMTKNSINSQRGRCMDTGNDGNYSSNYRNMEISTRDVFAVKIQTIDDVRLQFTTDLQKTHVSSSLYIKRGGAYDEQGGSKRDDKNVETIPTGESKNRVFPPIYTKFLKIFFPLCTKMIATLNKIWLYRTKAIVRVTHRNEIYTLDYAMFVRLEMSLNSLLNEKLITDNSTRKISVTGSNIVRMQIILSRLHSPTRLKLGYKYESMVPYENSITNTTLNRQQITKTTAKTYQTMSEAEVQSAVDHIPGHEEHSETMSVIAELNAETNCPDHQRLIYDPVNDTFIQATEAASAKNVGERRSDNVTDTGNMIFTANDYKTISHVLYNFLSIITNKDKNDNLTLLFTGTKFLAHQASEHISSSGPAKEATNKNCNPATTNSNKASTSSHLTPPVSSRSGSESEVSAEFSSESGVELQESKKPQHEQIDPRIKLQKEKFWKKMGKETDPRITALIPIHAPKMERLSRLQALKQRASARPKASEGDIVTGIMHDIDKTAEINYSVVSV